MGLKKSKQMRIILTVLTKFTTILFILQKTELSIFETYMNNMITAIVNLSIICRYVDVIILVPKRDEYELYTRLTLPPVRPCPSIHGNKLISVSVTKHLVTQTLIGPSILYTLSYLDLIIIRKQVLFLLMLYKKGHIRKVTFARSVISEE